MKPSEIIDLTGSPYSIADAAAAAILEELEELTSSLQLLRDQGVLNAETLKLYFGRTRFEQVAESNAIEGNPLSVGETKLAVLKGVTISGHDPRHSRDARALHSALEKLEELARESRPTSIQDAKNIHELVYGDQPGAGMFRTEPVRITGSLHTPPKTWHQVMDRMEQWEAWSQAHPDLPALLRAVVLHAWLVHVHPFIDGNGRTGRAIGNLELIRAGYPSLIIRRKDRRRYIEALRESDEGGDLGPLFQLIMGRLQHALGALEEAAERGQQYDKDAELLRRAQQRRLDIWNAGVRLLFDIVRDQLEQRLSTAGGTCGAHYYDDELELTDYIRLCNGRNVSGSWAFRIKCSVPALGQVERLAWVGYRDRRLISGMPGIDGNGPAILWSVRNQDAYPPWKMAGRESPGGEQMTTIQGKGDRWFVLQSTGKVIEMGPAELADNIADHFMQAFAGS